MDRIVSFIISLFVLLSGVARAEENRDPIDLRYFPFHHAAFEIVNAWDFYPGEFLTPADIQGQAPPRRLPLLAINPSEQNLGEIRHGTFRLQLRLPEAVSHYTIFFPELRSASRIWMNGRLASESGRPGISVADEKPALRPLVYNLEGTEQTLDIVVQISAYSNYQFISSSTPIRIGSTHLIYDNLEAARIRDAFVVGAIFIMAFYHFSLFALRRERLDPLLFGLFCLSIGLRTISRSEGLLLYEIFDQPDFHWQYRFEYWGVTVPTAACCSFIYVLFHKSISRRIVQGIVLIAALYTLCIGVLPLRIHGVLLIPFEILIILGSLYLVKCLALAKEQKDDSLLIASGFGAFILTIVNDVLKNHNIIKTVTLSHVGLFLFILVQAILISKRFSRAFRRLKVAEVEIRQLNDDLERKVKDRTQTIRIILDNVKAGFLLIGPDLTVKEGFTKSCQEIFGRTITVGQKLQDLLDLTERERAHFQMAVSQVFSGLLPDEVSLSQIHGRITIDQRAVSLQGSIVRDQGDAVYAILFTITDVTGLVNAEKDAQINQTLLNIMQDRAGFQSFLAESMRDLRAAMDAQAQADSQRVRMILHTLKGNFAIYGLDEVAQSIHQIEDQNEIGGEELERVSAQVDFFLSRHQDLLGLDSGLDAPKGIFVSNKVLDQLSVSLQSARALDEVTRAFEVWVQDARMVPIRSLFGAMLTHTSRLAAQLGKDVDIHVQGGDVLVNPELLGPVISTMPHLLRNALDHGIETPEQRSNKSSRARLDLSIERNPGQILITVADDGQGLDWERIREVAVEKGLVTPEAFDQASEEDRARLIFMPGFSTTQTLSEISGRGVGMSALLAAVQQLGGEIKVKSQRHRGCRFEISIPDAARVPLVPQVA
ncbi:MAG TPA: 7TM diverse intracellular signaling domain-containing protein [Oligoflexus sp.]|uniref:7TM diverse intracellular signaling domain-containing protein n=1 Tax=Oligoflexus sp. TaxID=1971216 RepID=UPI002D7E9A40|nr:7TM diverse intracellular signaling domain-containing protein [Oligoflexus sp.]HET9239807.1 7TM diverse intracellular signaling domain-containing protein [Oligoflexus sp.]